jgi:hypothetical protein
MEVMRLIHFACDEGLIDAVLPDLGFLIGWRKVSVFV